MEKAEKERKYKLSFRSVPTRRVKENSKNIAKRIQKIKKYHFGFISSQNWLENAEKERILKLSFRFVPTRRVIENSKKIAKKLKKIPSWIHFKTK